jgi:imidazolonepropionase-like amidohydrolase
VQAIQLATLNGALFLGVNKEIGSIDVGKAFDLVLVKDNPANNIKDIENVAIASRMAWVTTRRSWSRPPRAR